MNTVMLTRTEAIHRYGHQFRIVKRPQMFGRSKVYLCDVKESLGTIRQYDNDALEREMYFDAFGEAQLAAFEWNKDILESQIKHNARLLRRLLSKITIFRYRYGLLNDTTMSNVGQWLEGHTKLKELDNDYTIVDVPTQFLDAHLSFRDPLRSIGDTVYEVRTCWIKKEGIVITPRKITETSTFDCRPDPLDEDDTDEDGTDFIISYTVEAYGGRRTSLQYDDDGLIQQLSGFDFFDTLSSANDHALAVKNNLLEKLVDFNSD